jgi:hypothetical protein
VLKQSSLGFGWLISATFGLLLLLRGVESTNAVKIVLLVVAQTSLGSSCWMLLKREPIVSKVENYAIGFAIGTAIFTIADQILISMGILVKGNYVLATISVFFIALNFVRRRLPQSDLDQFSKQIYLIQIICIFLGFGELRDGSLLAVIILFIALFLLQASSFAQRFQNCTALCGAALSFLSFYLVKPEIVHGSWFLRPLFTQTNDAVFSESVAYSISNFGPNDYAAANGLELRYHWFSLAWSGMMQRITGAEPFTLTLHVVPIISFAVIAAILVVISFHFGLRGISMYLATIILFATSSSPVAYRFFLVVNTTNLFPLIWVGVFILLFLLSSKSELNWAIPSLIFSVLIILLSKIPYVVAPISGLFFSIVIDCFRKQLSKWKVVSLVGSVVLGLLVFSLYLKPYSWDGRSYSLTNNWLLIANGAPFFPFLPIVISLLLLASRFPAVWRLDFLKSESGFNSFLIGAVSTCFLSFILSGQTSELYFLNCSLLFGSIASSIAFSRYVVRPNSLLIYGSICFFGSIMIIHTWDRTTDFFSESNFYSLQFAIPFAMSLIVSQFARTVNRIGFKAQERYLFSALLLVGSIGIFVYQSVGVKELLPSSSTASMQEVKSLTWLSQNSDPNSIVATNRYMCLDLYQCDFAEDSYLISAVSNRRVFIEGPKFVAGGKPYPELISNRIEKSLAFANTPSEKTLRALMDSGISWFYLDTNFLPANIDITANPWQEWALIEYRLSNILILKFKT